MEQLAGGIWYPTIPLTIGQISPNTLIINQDLGLFKLTGESEGLSVDLKHHYHASHH
jgi:hypothetical protein